MRNATRRAFVRLMDFAIEEQVDFMLIAGDIFDGDWKDYNTGLFFVNQMGKLMRAAIPVFIVSGNHDAQGRMTKKLPLPDTVHLFSANRAETVSLDKFSVSIHGHSYLSRDVRENLAVGYPPPENGRFNIGMLHTSLNGRPGHEPYAPCNIHDLTNKGYDYWALGHVHRREIVGEDPWIVFPGNLQGRHVRESGNKGASLVTVEDGRVVDVVHHDFGVARWQICSIDLSGCKMEGEVYKMVRETLAEQVSVMGEDILAVRLVLTGSCELHGDLCGNSARWEAELRGIAASFGNIWLERVKFRTSCPPGGSDNMDIELPISELTSSVDEFIGGEENILEIIPELQFLKNRMPAELQELDGFAVNEPELRRELLEGAKEMLVFRLLKVKDS